MASISAIGYLPKPLTLHVGKASIMRRRTSFQKPEKFCNFNVSSSFVGCEDGSDTMDFRRIFERRRILVSVTGILAGAMCNVSEDGVAVASDFTDMPAIRGKDYGKSKMRYPDYTETKSGLQYKVTYWKTREFSCVSICTTNTRAFNYFILIPNSKRMQDLRAGSGPIPKMGETVVVDWDGYTIGYYGRIFEARNKTKGGSFEGGEKEFFKFRIGSQQVIPAFEEAVTGMALGGIRRIIVPPELGYPENDYNKSGPRPTTFSGQRALDFVLKNQGLIDKTLLFDIELLKIISN